MPLALAVVLVVICVTAVFGVAGYLIDRSAEREDPKEGDKA
jgi:hypothetical protein